MRNAFAVIGASVIRWYEWLPDKLIAVDIIVTNISRFYCREMATKLPVTMQDCEVCNSKKQGGQAN